MLIGVLYTHHYAILSVWEYPTIRRYGFCASTSALDRSNSSMFLLSTSHPAGGLPLGVTIISHKQEDTKRKSYLNNIFMPKEQKKDQQSLWQMSQLQQEMLFTVWPKTQLLLCVFLFLHRKWTWLHDGNNKIETGHCCVLIQWASNLLHSKMEMWLPCCYQRLLSCEAAKNIHVFLPLLSPIDKAGESRLHVTESSC